MQLPAANIPRVHAVMQCLHAYSTQSVTFALRPQQDEVDLEDKEDQFQPHLGNVVFASAHDGWAFRVGQMAQQYAHKLGCNASSLEQAFWGDFAFQPKTKRIIKFKSDQAHKHKPLFVQACLQAGILLTIKRCMIISGQKLMLAFASCCATKNLLLVATSVHHVHWLKMTLLALHTTLP